LKDERWRVLEPHLDRLLDLSVSERAAELVRLRTVDPQLAGDLDGLLALHDDVARENFLEDTPAAPPRSASLAGQTVGAYRLVESIGQGGMGSVWLAERSDGRFEGRVAVKLLNASLVGRAGGERFRREGSILARLVHPHIARLLDAGVSEWGQPYLVLEYVDGQHIDRYCDDRRLDVDARLRLFLDVAEAVSLAHANLVVHRDIKPSNVLVGKDGQVRLLDFGIAKLLEEGDEAGLETALTREGGRAFTPEFAAPEQLTGGVVTTATDVHALGTLLYLLLAGAHPAGSARSNPAQLLKAIVDTQPRRPSEAAAAADAAARSTSVESLRRELRGDLDTIVAKALKKDAAERYPSVDAMAADIRRYLAHEPIGARPDTFRYRAAKFVRRHRVGVGLALLAALATAAGTLAILWQANEARRQRDDAEAQLARATASGEFQAFLLSAGAPAGKPFVPADLLQQGELVVEKQFGSDDPLRAEILAGIGMQYLSAQRWEKAQPVLERADKVASRSNDPSLRARVRCPLALAWLVAGEQKRAEAAISGALADLPRDSRHALARAECLARWSEFGFFTDQGEPMVRHASEALETLSSARVPVLLTRLDAQAALAYGYYLTGQNARADAAFAELTKRLEQTGRERTLAAADAWNNWGLVHHRGDIRKAEPLYRRSLELHRSMEGDAVEPVVLHNYAGVLHELARYTEAEPLFREAIRAARDRKNTHVEIPATLELAALYAEAGRLPEARATLVTLDPYQGTSAFTPLRRAFLAHTRGVLATTQGDVAEARDQFAASVRIYETIPAKFSWGVSTLVRLARAELATGHPEAAETAARKALALAESFVEKDAPSYLVGISLAALGEVERAGGQAARGRATLEKAVGHLQTTLGSEHPETVAARRALS